MLERLADQLRSEDSRSGFEAKADMLSITGTTLDQFADLMQGLGYKSEKGEREKVKAVVEATPEAAEVKPETPADAAPVAAPDDTAKADAPDAMAPEDAKNEGPEMEVFYTFTWGGNRPNRQADGKPRGKPQGKQGGKPRGKPGQKDRGDKAQKFQARPPRKEKAIDPDNPFAAALMGLKTKE